MSTSEFRQRAGGKVQYQQQHSQQQQRQPPLPPQRRVSGSNSLPRPGFSTSASPPPRPSPVKQRSFSNSSSASNLSSSSHAPRSGSFTGGVSSQSAAAQRSNSFTGGYAAATSQSYNPNAVNHTNTNSNSNPSMNSNSYGGYGSSSVGGANGYGMGSNGIGKNDADNNKYAKKPNRKGGSSGGIGGMGMVIGMIGLFVYAITMTTLFFSKSSQTKTMLSRLDQPDTLSVVQKVEDLERRLKSSESTRQRAEHTARSKYANEVNTLERSNRILKNEVDEHVSVIIPEAHSKLEKHTKRERAFSDQIGWLMDATRREAKRTVLERFGPGPHKVEFTFVIQLEENHPDGSQKEYSFVVDLAPLDIVPHAIHLFLEQVDHGLMDGTHFYLNGPHIVQAGPQPEWETSVDGNDDQFYKNAVSSKETLSTNALGTLGKYEKQAREKEKEKEHHDDDDSYDDDEYDNWFDEKEFVHEDKRTKAFADLGLDRLAFPDYHTEYPHRAWTVGYTGRPGGPDWYINKVDNSAGHGPGGQAQYDLHEQGDSCFGIISMEGAGRNALAKYVYNSEVYADGSEWHHFSSKPIEIVHARVLTKEPIIDKHLHLTHLTSQHKVYNHRKKRRHIDEALLPESTVHHGEGVDPDHLPDHVREIMAKKKGVKYSINKVPHHGHRPRLEGAVEA